MVTMTSDLDKLVEVRVERQRLEEEEAKLIEKAVDKHGVRVVAQALGVWPQAIYDRLNRKKGRKR